jgi:hypothetical protein
MNITDIYEKNRMPAMLGGYTTVAYLKRCAGYTEAKEYGDAGAADSIVKKCVGTDNLQSIKAAYPGAVLLPVLKKNNALPLSLCVGVRLPVCLSVHCKSTRKRRNMPAIQRIFYKPVFCGEITPGTDYILADDVITQGGTISSLMRFVTQNMGNIRAILSIAYARGSKKIAPEKENLDLLEQRFGRQLNDFFEECGMGKDAAGQLTNSEILYLLKFSSVENIRKKYTACIIP